MFLDSEYFKLFLRILFNLISICGLICFVLISYLLFFPEQHEKTVAILFLELLFTIGWIKEDLKKD